MRRESYAWAAEAAAVLRKDLAVEFRTRYALSAVGLFAVVTLAAVSFTVGPTGALQVQAALLWIVLLFAALSGLSRTFVAEEDGQTADSLRLAASPVAVYLGKLVFNALLLGALAMLLVPGYVILMGVSPKDLVLLAAGLVVGCWGLAAVLTFTAALVARARARGALYAVVALPLVMPLLLWAVQATLAGLSGTGHGWVAVRMLVAYAGVMTTVAILLFEVVWQT